MSYSTLLFRVNGNTGIITLNRPERMNAVIEEMYSELLDVLTTSEKNPDIRALIITGTTVEKNGLKKQIFCAGADLKEHAVGDRTPEQKKKYIRLAHEACRRLYEFPKPTVAAINGPARGAGVEMAMNCDFIIMASTATLGFPETGLGTCVGGGVTKHLALSIGIMKAKELIYSGKIIDGVTAMRTGIALDSCPVNELLERTQEFVSELAKKAPVSMKLAKDQLNRAVNRSIKEVLDTETDAILECMRTEDWHEGIRAFNEKRIPLYKGK